MTLHKKAFLVWQQLRFYDTDDLKVIFERCLWLANLKQVACIIHDKDTRQWVISEEDKWPHFHVVLTFSNQISSLTVANQLKVPENCVLKMECSAKTNFLYLIHKNHPERHQYDAKEVLANFDYEDYVSDAELLQNPDDIITLIEKWEIKPYERPKYVDWKFYSKYKKRINTAVEHNLILKDLNLKNKQMQCVYISWPSGCWKSLLSKHIAELNGYSPYNSDQWRHPFDNYNWQECIILDDFRDDLMPLNDFLKLTDNNTSSKVWCRFYNKTIAPCKLLIVNSVVPIKNFYNWAIDEYNNETKHQIYRRFTTMIHMSDEYITWYAYDKLFQKYLKDFKTTNMFSNMYPKDWPIENLFLQNMREKFSDRIIPEN